MSMLKAKVQYLGPGLRELLSAALRVALGAALLVVVVILFFRGGNFKRERRPVSEIADVSTVSVESRQRCGPRAADGQPVRVKMLYSADKLPWIEYAAARFAALCPNIQLDLSAMSDGETVHAILAGSAQPHVWAPADDLVLDYLDARWRQRTGRALFAIDQKVELVQSPLVLLIWDQQARVLDTLLQNQPSDDGFWMRSLCPLLPRDPDLTTVTLKDMVPGRWIDWYAQLAPPASDAASPAPDTETGRRRRGRRTQDAPVARAPAALPLHTDPRLPSPDVIERWGSVKLGHTPPNRSASGLQTLYLMAFDYLLPRAERATASTPPPAVASDEPPPAEQVPPLSPLSTLFAQRLAMRRDALQRWLQRCEAGVEPGPTSARHLAEAMFTLGPSRYDGVLVYEHVALALLQKIEGADSAMRVRYPQPTLVSRHPAVLLGLDDPAQRDAHDAARRWLDFLRSREMQARAIELGFRPIDPAVSIRAHDDFANPFLRARRSGISIEYQSVEIPPPSGEALTELIEIWQAAVGRN